MLAEESKVAWELWGEWTIGPPWRTTSSAKEGGEKPWPKRIMEDLLAEKSLIARDEKRLVFNERAVAEVWRERINREAVSAAERWDLRQVRLVRKDGALAKAIEQAGLTLDSCEGYYVAESDFIEHILPLELIMAMGKRVDALERTPR